MYQRGCSFNFSADATIALLLSKTIPYSHKDYEQIYLIPSRM